MIELWLGVALLMLPLVFVLLWPALRGAGAQQENQQGSKREALAALYREQQAELKAALASGSLDEQQYAQLEAEMARNLLAAQDTAEGGTSSVRGRGLLIGLAVLTPLLAVGIYFQFDRYDDLALYQDIVASQQGTSNELIEARITSGLRERAEAHPDDLTSHYVLAQRLLAGNDLPGAVKAYRYVVEREPQAAGVKAELAQALFFAEGSKVTDEVRQLVDEVLEVQPDNGTALGLAGIAAFGRSNYREARDYWQRALDQLPADLPERQVLAAWVTQAEKALEESVGSQGQADAESKTSAVEGPAIRVIVSLGENVSAQPDVAVFIYARTAGNPMPLAIVRLAASQLPAEVVLNESRSVMPGRSLKDADSVQVVAHLALQGDVRPAPGDWQGTIDSLAKSEWGQPVSITIDQQL